MDEKPVNLIGVKLMLFIGVIILIVSQLFALYLGVDSGMHMVGGVVVLLAYTKFIMAQFFVQGWVLHGLMKRQRLIFKLPRRLFIPYAFFIFLIVIGVKLTGDLGDDPSFASTQINMYLIWSCYALGILGSLIFWFQGMALWTALEGEHTIRMKFEAEGKTPEEIEERINKLKEIGVLPKE